MVSGCAITSYAQGNTPVLDIRAMGTLLGLLLITVLGALSLIIFKAWQQRAASSAQALQQQIERRTADLSESEARLTQANAALRESEQAFQELLTSITDYVWSADIGEGRVRYRYYSPVVEQITGYPVDHFMSGVEAWLNIIHPADRAEAEAKLDREFEGKIVHHEYRIIRSDGKIRWLSGTTSPKLDNAGQVIRLHGVVSDITQRKQAEQLLTGQQTILEAIARGAPLPQILTQLVQFIESQAEGVFCAILLLDDNRTQLCHGAAPSLPEGYTQVVEGLVIGPEACACGAAAYRAKTVISEQIEPDPHWQSCRDFVRMRGLQACWSTPIFSSESQVLGTFAMYYREPRQPSAWERELVNLSTYLASIAIEREQAEKTRQRLEAHLRHSQKIEAVGTLAGGIAHDFNNLLTAIMGYTGLAQEQLPPHHPVLNDIRGIENMAQRASGLVRQLLTFARRQEIEPRVFDLNELIQNTSQMLHRLLDTKITLETDLAPDLWPVRADYGQFEQVIVNLVLNAVDAMPNGGRLLINTENRTIQASQQPSHLPDIPANDYVVLSVTDTGIGIPAEIKTRLFEPFFTTKEVGKGTGLGLAMCFGIVKQNNGYIWVESEPAQGTTFEIYLPREVQKIFGQFTLASEDQRRPGARHPES